MSSLHVPSDTNRPGKSLGRRLYFWGILGVLVAILVASLFITSALKTSSSQQGTPAGPANAGQPAPGAVANPNPVVATPAPAQTDPAPVPSGLSPAKALDWRLVQWDKLTNNGVNESVYAPRLDQTTQQWISIINDWIYYLPSGWTGMVPQYANRPWAADGVLASTNNEFYPKLVGGVIRAAQIGSTGNASSDDLPGAQVRFYYSELVPPGAPMGEQRTFKLVYHVSSDGVSHVLVSSCKGDVPRC